MVDTVPVGIVIAEAPSGRIVRGNARMEEIIGQKRMAECVADYAAFAGLHPDGRPIAVHEYPLARAVAGLATHGMVCQLGRGDGGYAWVRIDAAPIHGEAGAVVAGIAAVTCIEAERSAQALLEDTVAARTAALARSTSRNQALFDHSPFDIMVLQAAIDGAITIEEANASFCRTTGLPPAGLRMRTIEAALGGQTAASLAADCRTALREGGFECEHTLDFPVGERLMRLFYRVLPDERAGIRRVLVTQIDLSEVRRVEAALRQAMRLEGIGQLTGGVAHDFNNLLTAILGSLELLGGKVDDARQQRWIRTAVSAAQRGATLTHQLLAYARKQFLAPVAMDIPAAIGAMAELIRGSLGGRIALAIDLPPTTWAALADPAHLELALVNLVVNARDAMHNGGTLALSTDNLAAGDETLPAELEPQDYVRVAVADTGMGMEPEIVSRAMEPFFTTKGIGDGSGLGLSQAYGYARQLGGTLRLNSRPGEGTVVEIFLPRAVADT